jgi:hypothetical protein
MTSIYSNTFRSPLWLEPVACVAKAVLILLAVAYSVSVSAASSVVPSKLHGFWSTKLEYCGRDSDGNYFFGADEIGAWEVHWEELKLRSRQGSSINLSAMEIGHESRVAVAIRIKIIAPKRISFEVCEGTYCWRESLRKCPKEKPQPFQAS